MFKLSHTISTGLPFVILLAVTLKIRFGRAFSCDENWSDRMHFDCQLYEGAGWCKNDGDVGVGWCQSREHQDVTYGSCLAKQDDDYYFGWGDFANFSDSEHPLTAAQACTECGAKCSSSSSPRHLRELNPIPDNCVDFLDPTGKNWRDNYGYTCNTYFHGGFCSITDDGKYEEGGLWNLDSYGTIENYTWWADNGWGFPNNGTMLNAYEACCTCGGGKIAISAQVRDLEVKMGRRGASLEWKKPDDEEIYTYVAIMRELHSDTSHQVVETGREKAYFKNLRPEREHLGSVYVVNGDWTQGLVKEVTFST